MKVEDRGVKPPLPRRGGTARRSQSRSLQAEALLAARKPHPERRDDRFWRVRAQIKYEDGHGMRAPTRAMFTGTVAMFTPASQTQARWLSADRFGMTGCGHPRYNMIGVELWFGFFDLLCHEGKNPN